MYPAVIRRKFPFALASRREEEGEGGVRITGFFFLFLVASDGPTWTAPEPLGVKGEGAGVK